MNKNQAKTIDYTFRLLVLFVSFSIYLVTLNPNIGLYDAGDMTTAACILGIPHPPGYPFYCLLGKTLVELIGFGNYAYRINMLSAFSGSLACFFVFLITRKITGSNLPALFSSLLIVFSYSVWQQSTFASQYIVHLTFGTILIFLILKSLDSSKYLWLSTFILGLSLTHHRQTLFIAFGAILFFLIKLFRKRKKIKIKDFLILPILFIIPLFLFLYLPIRASTNPPLNWGDPDTLKRFISHIMGEQYGFLFLKLSLKEHIMRIASQCRLFLIQLTIIPCILGIAGIILMAIKNTSYFILLFSILFVNIVVSSTYNHPSIELYYLLPFAIFSVFSGYTIFWIMKIHPFFKLASPLFFVICGQLFLKNYPLNNRARYYFTYDYGMNILRPIPNGGVIFVSDDTHTFPTEYLHYVEMAKPHILLVDTHLFHFEWKANLIKNQFPDLIFDFWPQALRKEIVTYDEVSWERQKDMIEKNVRRPFYIFPCPFIAQFYEFIPCGVFSRIVDKNISKEEINNLLRKSNYDFKVRKTGVIDSSSNVCLINYAVSHYNRARLYYNIGMPDDAKIEVEKALKLHPEKYPQAIKLKEMLSKGL